MMKQIFLLSLFAGSITGCIGKDGEPRGLVPFFQVNGEITGSVAARPGDTLDVEVGGAEGIDDVEYKWSGSIGDRLDRERERGLKLAVLVKQLGAYFLQCDVSGTGPSGELAMGTALLRVDVTEELPPATIGIIDRVVIDGGEREYGGYTNIQAGRTIDVYVHPVPGATDVTVEFSGISGATTPIDERSFRWMLPSSGAEILLQIVVEGKVAGREIREEYEHLIVLE